jgi:hypothetical protein
VYFNVQSTQGKTYLFRYQRDADEWTLQSGFDCYATAGEAGHRINHC